MNNLFKKIAIATVGLVMAIGVGVGIGSASGGKDVKPASAETAFYTITFKTGSGDGTKGSTTTAFTDYVSDDSNMAKKDNSNYFVTATNSYYQGSKGLKLGVSGSGGTLKFNLAAAAQVTPTKITVSAASYSSNSSKKATLTVNGVAGTAMANTTLEDMEYAVTTAITYIELSTDRYAWIGSITVTYTVSTTPSVSFNNPTTTVGVGQSVTNAATGNNLGGNSISYAASNVSPAGCITLNTSTGQVTGNTAGGTARITASATVSGTTYSAYYDITVLALLIYDEAFSDWTWPNTTEEPKGTAIPDRLIGADSSHQWRLSIGEWFASGGSTHYLLGDYNQSKADWDVFSTNKYYSGIASVITSNSYGCAMYSQNFNINKPTKIDFEWGATSGIGATNAAYIVASTNGGYSWTVLATQTGISSTMSISWEGNTYASTNNVIVGLAFTSSNKNPQLRNISMKIYGDSISTTNVWAVREITVSGNDNVEAEQTTTYTATVVTTGYETPANTSITWSSGTTTVATVGSSTGVVTGVAVGSSVITATAADGKGATATKTITVTAKLKRLGTITLNTDNVTKSFVRNSSFNYTGLVVTAHYANGFDDEIVVPTSVSTPDMTTAGNGKTVTVTYTINGTSANASYTINVTPIVSETITISGSGASLVDGRYNVTTGPNNSSELSVTYDGDEESISSTPTNEKIYYEDGYLVVESTENDTGTITFTVGNATAYLDVTVIADETLSYVTPADGEISCVQHQTVNFEFSLVNASSGVWTAPTNSAYTITGSGDETGYTGAITLNEVCTDLEAEFSVLTSKDTLTISLYLTATADSITSISVKTNPTKTTYVVGETFSSAGLVISASRTSGVSRDLESNEYTLKNAPTVLNDRGVKSITVELVSDTTKTTSFNITVNMPSGLKIVTKTCNNDGGYEATLITNSTTLKAGMKVAIGCAAYEEVMGAYSSGNNVKPLGYNDDNITVAYDSTNKKFTFSGDGAEAGVYTLGGNATDGWTFLDVNENYLYKPTDSSGANNYMKASSTATTTHWSITLTSDGSDVTISNLDSTTRPQMRRNSTQNQYLFSAYESGKQKAIELYSVTEVEPTYSYQEVDLSVTIYDFIRAVYNNSDYYTCTSSGTGSSLTNWSNITSDDTYIALTETDKDNLANAVASSPDGTKNSSQMVVDFLSQYDYIIWKYGEDYDYLGRVDAGTAKVKSSVNTLIGLVVGNTNATSIIVVMTLISTTAIGGYFFLRKKKED